MVVGDDRDVEALAAGGARRDRADAQRRQCPGAAAVDRRCQAHEAADRRAAREGDAGQAVGEACAEQVAAGWRALDRAVRDDLLDVGAAR